MTQIPEYPSLVVSTDRASLFCAMKNLCKWPRLHKANDECPSIWEAMKKRLDASWLPDGEVTRWHDGRSKIVVPLLREPWLPVEARISPADDAGLRELALEFADEDEPTPIGYVSPGEGRWDMRFLISAALLARTPPKAGDCTAEWHKDPQFGMRDPLSPRGMADLACLALEGSCFACTQIYEDEFVPDL